MDKKEKRRAYRVYHNLKKKGNTTVPRGRTVVKRAIVLSDIENKYIKELVQFGYCVCDDLFATTMN